MPLGEMKPAMRRMARFAWIYFLRLTGALRWAEWRLGRRGATVVLTFHRVLPEREYLETKSPRGMLVRSDTFEKVLACAVRRFEVVGLEKGNEANSHRLRLAITFDDGWQDNYTWAAPIARTKAVPIAIFICPALVGRVSPFWPERVTRLFDRATGSAATGLSNACAALRINHSLSANQHTVETAETAIQALKSLSPSDREEAISGMQALVADTEPSSCNEVDATMDWRSIAELAGDFVTFGSHTQNHEILPLLPLPEAEREIRQSKQAIAERLGRPCSFFAYPNGDTSPEVRNLVKQAGYELALLNRPGAWLPDTDPFLIPRVNLWEGSLVGATGRFSATAFRYVAIWKAYRSI